MRHPGDQFAPAQVTVRATGYVRESYNRKWSGRWARVLSAGKPLAALVALLVISSAAGNARASAFPGPDAPGLSGTYSFRALVKGRRHSCAERGHLEFDWLGDVSGQALAVPGKRGVASTPGRCDVLISGTYSPAAKPGAYKAEVTLTPLSPDYPIDHGKGQTLALRIVPRGGHGNFELLAFAHSHRELLGVAELRTRGPS
jgi:hypothetical protein